MLEKRVKYTILKVIEKKKNIELSHINVLVE